MTRLTEQDKVLMLSKLEEEWSIRRVAAHNGLNKSIAVNGTFNLISKAPVHTA
jgi:hypothetical protein